MRVRRPGRRTAIHLLLAAVLGALLLPLLPAAASAEGCDWTNPATCVTGVTSDLDCKDVPAPARPDSGLAGWFLSEPKKPAEGDPFKPGATVSPYDVYGYAGLDFRTYDLGCGGTARDPEATSMNMIANLIYTPAMWLVALDNSVREYAYQPGTMWGWTNDLVARASDALHKRVFTVWGAVALLLVGVWLMWGARAGNMSHAVVTAGWALLVMALVTAVAAWPVQASTVADEALTGALGQISGSLSSQANEDDRPPAARASGILTDTVLYKQYLRGTLGSADSDIAVKYGPDLYRARALSWQDMAAIKKDPSQREKVIAEKKKLWEDTAEAIKSADPDAYEYLVGRKGAEKVGAALLALVSALVVTPFDLMASLLILIAFLIIRLAVAFLPAIGTVGILRPAAGPLRGLLRTVLAAIINCVIFGAGSAVFLLAVQVITSTNSLAGWQQILLLWLTGLILWLLLRPYRRLTQLTGVDPFGELAGGIGKMHKKVFGDMKQLAIAGAGAYLGDAAALEANDHKRARQAERLTRPESWSRAGSRGAAAAGGPPSRAEPGQAPGGAPAHAGAAAQRPESGSGRRADGGVVLPARVSAAPATDEPAPLPPVRQYAASESGLAEESESYVIYRPDRGYAATARDDHGHSARLSRIADQAAQVAGAVRDATAAAATRADQDRRE